MPTGGATTVRRSLDADTGKEVEEEWPFHGAMWELKVIKEAREKYGGNKSGKAGAGWRGRKLDKHEEITALGKDIAGLTAKLAAMPAAAAGRADTERELKGLQDRMAELRGVKQVVKQEEGAAPTAEGGAGASGAADKQRASLGGAASIAALLNPIVEQVSAMASSLKETEAEAAARRAHELELANISATAQVKVAKAQAEAFAGAFAAALKAGRGE